MSPLLIFSAIGAVIYFNFPGHAGTIAWTALTVLGLITGVIWANHVSKKYGAHHYMSRVSASPDLDGDVKSETKKNEAS